MLFRSLGNLKASFHCTHWHRFFPLKKVFFRIPPSPFHALVLLSDNIKNKRAWWLFAIAIMIHSTAIILVFAIGGIILEKKLGDNKICISVSIIASLVIAVGYGIGVKLLLHFVPRYSMYTMDGSTYSIFNSTGGGRIVLLYIVLKTLFRQSDAHRAYGDEALFV